MWLYPVALIAIVGLFISVRHGLLWTWGLCLQQLIILGFTVLGFYFVYAPGDSPFVVPKETIAAVATITAWTLFFVFNIGQRILLNQMSLDLSTFRVHSALARRRLVHLLTWGPPGRYWCDMAVALDHYSRNQKNEADALLRKWANDPRMPGPVKDSLVGYFMLGRIVLNDWVGIIHEFEKNHSSVSDPRSFVAYQMASRAYAELKKYSEAVECIEKANVQATKVGTVNLDINFMTLFSLFGALEQLQSVLSRCKDFRALPQYLRDYWLGRCHAVRGEPLLSVQALKRCKQVMPAGMQTFDDRINVHLRAQEARLTEAATPDQFQIATSASADVIDRAWQVYDRLRITLEVLKPSGAHPALIALMVLLVVAYLVSNCQQFLSGLFEPQKLTAFHNACYGLGELSAPRLLKGEWWRTITYLFLHGNTAHLLLNTFALYLFGKSVENTFGSFRFLIIFFGAGVLSGLLQITLVPTDAAIGASGAILGVFGAAIAGTVKLKDVLPASVRRTELRWMIGVAIAQVVFDQLVNQIASMTDHSPNGVRIASFAHLGGMLTGFAIGMLLHIKKFTSGPHSAPPLEEQK